MKRGLCFTLLLTLMLNMCACGNKQNVTTWQEQYDLGVHYLSEGNYEEAILSFTAAIEIDPRQPDAYVGMADAYIGLGDYQMARETINQGQEVCGDNEAFNRIINNLSFLQSEESGIKITSLYFDKESYCAGDETDFLISVVYRCPAAEPCLIMTGANTDEPNSFAMMNNDHQVTGSGEFQYSFTVTPVQWEDSDFGIYVNLSEVNHAVQWTPFAWDALYIDSMGNMSTALEYAGTENGSDGHATLLSKAVTDNILQFEEINFLGHKLTAFDIETMKSYMRENGMHLTTNDDLEPGNNDDYWWVSAEERDLSFSASITALQNKDEDYVSLWGYNAGNEGRTQYLIGMRDISTYEPLRSVLSKLGFTNIDEIVEYTHQIRNKEYSSWDEIYEDFQELSCTTDTAYYYFDSDNEARVLDNGNLSVDRVALHFSFFGTGYYYYNFSMVFGWNYELESNDLLTDYNVSVYVA